MDFLKTMLACSAILAFAACSDDASTQAKGEKNPVSLENGSASVADEAPGDSMVFFNPSIYLLGYRNTQYSAMCNLPSEPTLIPVNEWTFHRLMPVLKHRLDQRGGTENCHYYLVAWEHSRNNAYYNLDHVGQDSIVITMASLNENSDVVLADEIQEFFALETCGETLNLNTPIVVKNATCGPDNCSSFDQVENGETWIRQDLLAAREQCVARCIADTTGSDLLRKMIRMNPEKTCGELCDGYAMEATTFYCNYIPDNDTLGISCSMGGCGVQVIED